MIKILKRKQKVIIFSIVFVIVFFALATTLKYSPLEILSISNDVKTAVFVLTFPAAVTSFFPSVIIVDVLFCNSPNACPGFFDAYTTANAIIMILISFFSATLYGFLAVLVACLFGHIKQKLKN